MTEASKIISEAQAFVDNFNADYETKHLAFENQFWGTKMSLSDPIFNVDNLSKTKQEKEDLLSDYSIIEKAKSFQDSLPPDVTPKDLVKTLDIIIRTCQCYAVDPTVKAIRDDLNTKVSKLEMDRNHMELGYKDPTNDDGNFVSLSSVGLRNVMVTNSDPTVRQAAYDGLRKIGPFLLDHGFVEIIKQRNAMAKKLGFEDYYDMKVTRAEGMSKKELFTVLDTLEVSTRPLLKQSLEDLEKVHGKDALEPWNTGYMLSGKVTEKMDPYFPFETAPRQYLRSYAKLGISYLGSTLNLDLLERKNKYSNGFCHWPQVAWTKPDGSWQPSTANFTTLADPNAVGSGLRAIKTLMHEAGHAAHFANIKQPSPLFGQEHAPFSAALAEGQSMFLDALVSDAAWRAKYARDVNGNPIPFDIIEEQIKSTHPFKVRGLRSMLSVPYFEKALYELPDEEVTSERIQTLADDIELKIQGGLSARPLLSVPHIISDEASCYYHSYVLAEMCVYQTREFIMKRDGYIVDNPKVGPTLQNAYWIHGNSVTFLELVKNLTGRPLSGDAWTNELKQSVDEAISESRKDYDQAIKDYDSEQDNNKQSSSHSDNIDLNMTIRFVDGDTVIADSSQENKTALTACEEFETYVTQLKKS